MLDFGQEKWAKSFVEFLVSNIHTDLRDLTDLFLMMICLIVGRILKMNFRSSSNNQTAFISE